MSHTFGLTTWTCAADRPTGQRPCRGGRRARHLSLAADAGLQVAATSHCQTAGPYLRQCLHRALTGCFCRERSRRCGGGVQRRRLLGRSMRVGPARIQPTRLPPVLRQLAASDLLRADHGGGYSYRLCSLDGVVNETCFRQTVLRFAGGVQWIQYNNQTYQYDDTVKLPRFELPRTTTTKGTYPPGSEWARVGVPSCRLCDQSICGPGLKPNMSDAFQPGYWMGNATMYGGREWFEEEQCAQHCAGHNMSACPPFMTQFAEPLPGISGYTGQYAAREGLPFSLVDRVIVPPHLKPGAYLMSWRWDAEQSHQVWQSCADIQIV
mmetsp:Transcript_78362/g.234884  ORF Transcript_78362/g.234884 Transcript_78362/m.234884 type:complete len:322 (-) Transcript_78362:372-1337(-)